MFFSLKAVSFLIRVSPNTRPGSKLYFQIMDGEKAFVAHLLSSFNFNIMQIVRVSPEDNKTILSAHNEI